MQKKIKDNKADNAGVRACLCVANCCLDCFRRFLEFVTEQAYTRVIFIYHVIYRLKIALTGNNFCVSGIGAFKTVVSNPFLYGFTSGLGNVIILIGKFVIALSTTFCGYLIVSKTSVRNKLVCFILPNIVNFCILYLSFFIGFFHGFLPYSLFILNHLRNRN